MSEAGTAPIPAAPQEAKEARLSRKRAIAVWSLVVIATILLLISDLLSVFLLV